MSETPKNSSGDVGFSQAEIDALMNPGGEGSPPDQSATPPPAKPAAAADDAGAVSQDDIDAMMAAAQGDSGEDHTTGGDEGSAESTAPAEEVAGDQPLDSMGRPFDDAAAMMAAAIAEEQAEKAAVAHSAAASAAAAQSAPLPPLPEGAQSLDLADFTTPDGTRVDGKRVTMLSDVNLNVRIELGRTHMLVEDVLKLDEGSVVELDKLAGDPVDVYVNNRLVARGEVLVLNDSFCVRVSDVVSADPHRVVT